MPLDSEYERAKATLQQLRIDPVKLQTDRRVFTSKFNKQFSELKRTTCRSHIEQPLRRWLYCRKLYAAYRFLRGDDRVYDIHHKRLDLYDNFLNTYIPPIVEDPQVPPLDPFSRIANFRIPDISKCPNPSEVLSDEHTLEAFALVADWQQQHQLAAFIRSTLKHGRAPVSHEIPDDGEEWKAT